jgi:hypothetical protein
MSSQGNRFLTAYAGIVTLAFAVIVVSGSSQDKRAAFDEIDVARINVREPDGTLRMVIASHARLPGLIVHGKEQPLERPQAGMLFYNDEASEIGGLIFGGRKNAKGEVVDSGGSLSFDRYEANQVVQMLGVDDREDRIAGIVVSDSEPGGRGHRRILVGREGGDDATVALMDTKGKARLVLRVAADGTPTITLLNNEGRVVNRIGAPASRRGRNRSISTAPN